MCLVHDRNDRQNDCVEIRAAVLVTTIKLRLNKTRTSSLCSRHRIVTAVFCLLHSLSVRSAAVHDDCVQDTIHELALEKIGQLQENTNLTDQLRLLMIECRHQEQDLDLSRKAVVRIDTCTAPCLPSYPCPCACHSAGAYARGSTGVLPPPMAAW